MDDPEYRFAAFEDKGADVLTGIVIRYGHISNMGPFREQFRAGSIELLDPVMTLQHQRSQPVARMDAGLTMEDSADALRVSVKLPDTRLAREARELVAAGILRGFSLEFHAQAEEWAGDLRTVTRCLVPAFSLVDKPAHGGCDVDLAMRSRPAHLPGRPHHRRRAWY